MSAKLNGGCLAFPSDMGGTIAPGLTKRELFAAMALNGLLASSQREASFEAYAKCAVYHTDALLAALEAKP